MFVKMEVFVGILMEVMSVCVYLIGLDFCVRMMLMNVW